MELLTTPKSAYLLEAGLEVLHQQSNEWLNEIAFWRDEVAFLYVLILSKTMKSVPVNAKSTIEKMEGELVKITSGELDDLQREVEMHEYFLCKMLESKREDQEEFREKHKLMAVKFDRFEKRFRTLKKEIFEFVKANKKSLLVS